MAVQTIGKALSIFGISPSVVEVFFVDHEEQVNSAKFADHLAKHGISYDTDDEYNMRKTKFVEKDKKIKEINSSQNDYTVGHNYFSTFTIEEYNQMKGHIPHSDDLAKKPTELGSSYKPEVNWVTAGKVNAIQNQGQCGSCWAFSSIAAIESAYAISSDDLVKLSEQQLVDCAKYASGCDGGNYAPAFYYASNNKIVKESTLPYTGIAGTCPYTSDPESLQSLGVVDLSNYSAVTPKSVSELKAALSIQPVGIAVDASSVPFQHFTSGVVTSGCGQSLDHAVTAVGYGSYEGQDYVLVRNSWGTSWGMDGYIYIALNDSDICGVMIQPYIPTI